jgi:PKD repeat protein
MAGLPGGTPITVSITAPADNATLPAAPFDVTGTASVGVGAPVANTTLIYVVDVSGSTATGTGTPGRCPRQNVYDTTADTTLDCELLAVRDLNAAAIATGTVAKIGFVAFAGTGTDTLANITSAAALDLSPLGGVSTLTAPDANEFTPTPGMTQVFPVATNLDWVVQSAYLAASTGPTPVGWPSRAGGNDGFTLFGPHDVGLQTNYFAALTALRTLLASSTTSNNVVAFLSDGSPNLTVQGQPLSAVLSTLPSALKIYTFAIGSSATCGSSSPSLNGSLAQISTHFGTTCQVLPNPADAADIVPAVITSQLTSVGLTVDGVPQTGVTTSPSLPQTGPGSVSFTESLNLPARPAPYAICATASGKDGAGNGDSDPSCINVTIQAPPTVTLDGGPAGVGPVPEGTSAPLAGTVTGATSTSWTVSGGTGHCTFADATAVPTSVTCDDNGSYTVTLTASDGVNPPVSVSEPLEVTNVDPVPTLTVSPGTIPLHGTALAHTTIVDPGTNDTETCSNHWGDGTPDTLGCDDSHVYDTAGTYTVTTTATDDDGGTGTSTALLVVNGPPTASVLDANGNEGSAIPLFATATDPEHDPLHYAWTATPGAGLDAGASCTFSDASALAPTVTCNDDGTWNLKLTVSDNVNVDVVATAMLTVANVAPTATLTVTPAMIPLHGSASAHTTVADAGSNDTQTCSISWGDGIVTTGCDQSHTYDFAGPQNVVATVTDDDGGTTTAQATLLVNAPPAASVANSAGNEGAAIPLSATVTDPNSGDTLTYAWTAAPAGTVDAGAACAFTNPTALATSISCTDDGVWNVSLTASDGVNPPVTSSGTVTVANVAPSLVVSNPAAGSSARSVVFNGVVSDPGSNDTQTCSIDWGDGSSATVPVTGGFCNATHTYAASLAAATIDASATDDDGATSTHVTRALTFNRPPVCTTVRALPSELWPPDGDFRIVLLVGATDPDGGHVTYHVDSVTQDEALSKWDDDHHWYDRNDDDRYKKTKKLVPDAVRGIGPILFLRAWRDPHGDGRVYTIGFTVTDSSGATCSGTTTVSVRHDEHHPAVKTPGVSVNSFGS